MKKEALWSILSIAVILFSTSAMGANYYLPYCTSNETQWTGMGIRNLDSTTSANVTVTTYNQSGSVVETLNRSIAASGQDVFLIAQETDVEGWILVEANVPLAGLCFFGKRGADNYIADIPFASETSYVLYVPHLAQDATWDSFIMVSNPNSSSAVLTATIIGQDGSTVASQTYSLSANGSSDISIDALAGTSLSDGSLHLSCTQPITAFVLYQNIKTGNYSHAGINAVNPLTQDGGWVLYDDFSSGSIDTSKWNIDDSSATISIENGEARFVHNAGVPNDSSWLYFPNADQILAVKATLRVASCTGDVRCRLGGEIFDDDMGNYVWHELRAMYRDSEIQAWVGAVDTQTNNTAYQIFYHEFESPLTIVGNSYTLSTVFTLPTWQFKADGYGTVYSKPEGSTLMYKSAPFFGIGTRSSNGDGPCTVYFDDVYVIYKN
jgi:hypothetical protein